MYDLTLEGSAISPGEVRLDRLARLFPNATRMRIPIRVKGLSARVQNLGEKTVIELGTCQAVLFRSTLPLEINDVLRVQNSNGSFAADIVIVATQTFEKGCAVAARFVSEVPNWILTS